MTKKRRSERRGKSSRRVSPLYFHSLASYLFLWGFFSLPPLPSPLFCRGSPRILEERKTRGTSSDSRTRARGEVDVMAFSRLPLQPGDTLRAGGEKPRARLMALRGCHGYREPHGSDATAAPHPAESPFILEKHYKNARAARAASRSLLVGSARIPVSDALCVGCTPGCFVLCFSKA